MRLLMVATVGYTHWSFLKGQNRFMATEGVEVHVAAAEDGFLERVATRDGVPVHAVPMSRNIDPRRDAVAVVRLWRLMRRIRPDVVHLSTPKAALLGAIAATFAGVPVRIFLARGSVAAADRGWAPWINRLAERLTARLCTEVVAVSPSLLDFLRREGIVPRDRGLVIRAGMSNGVDGTHFQPDPARHTGPDAAPVVGFVGRLGREKGIAELAAAWKCLRERFPAARLLFVGGWERVAGVSAEVRAALESDERVEFVGHVDDVRPCYHRMRVLAFPSHREGFPNAPMEAAALGVPCVGSRAVGVVDAVVDGVTGALVDLHDPAALAAGLARYLEDPGLARRHGDAGRERVLRDFDPAAIWTDLLSVYRRLLAGHRGFRTRLPEPLPAGSHPAAGRAA